MKTKCFWKSTVPAFTKGIYLEKIEPYYNTTLHQTETSPAIIQQQGEESNHIKQAMTELDF